MKCLRSYFVYSDCICSNSFQDTELGLMIEVKMTVGDVKYVAVSIKITFWIFCKMTPRENHFTSLIVVILREVLTSDKK